MSTTTKEKLDEMMIIYSNRINDISNVIDKLENKINTLIDKKSLLESETIDPLKIRMDEILNSMSHTGTLYKNKYYGVEDLQGWAWYKNLGYSSNNFTYIDDNTFYIDKDDRTLKAGQYLLVKDSKYGYMERYVKKVVRTGTITKVYLDTSKGPLSDPISKQYSYVSHMNSYPSCEDPGKMPERTDCCDYDDKQFLVCEDADELEWKIIQTEIEEGSGSQQIEIQGGIPPYDWSIENTNDFQLLWDQTESTRNTLTYNYNNIGTLINVRDYCGGFIEEEIMPPEYDYIPGVFKIIPNVIYENVDHFPMFIKISPSSGTNGEDLSIIFDDIGDNWKKIYIQDSYPFGTGNDFWIEKGIWDSDTKHGTLYFSGEVYSGKTYYLYYGSNLDDNDLIQDGTLTTTATMKYNVWFNNNVKCDAVQHFNNLNWTPQDYWQFIGSGYSMNNTGLIQDYDGVLNTNKDYYLVEGYHKNLKNAIFFHPEFNTISVYDNINNKTYYVDIGKEKNSFFDIYYTPNNPPEGQGRIITTEYFLNFVDPFTQVDEDEYEKEEMLYDRLLMQSGNAGENFYMNPGIKFDASDGALEIKWQESYYSERLSLLRSNKKYWSGWTHIAITWNSSTRYLKLYIDGFLDNSEYIDESYDIEWTSWPKKLCDDSSYHLFRPIKPLKAIIDEHRLYQIELSENRINMSLLDMKDKFIKYEKIALPKRVEV